MNRISGIIIPAVTPFKESGEIDFDALQFNYEKWNGTAVDGYMALGSNGEYRMLSDDDALQVLRIASEAASKDRCFIAGVGRESAYETIRFLMRVSEAGIRADYYSVLTPHYFRKLMTDDALYAYYTQIADASPVPILLYVAPAFSNDIRISPELIRRLADHPNIHGIKDTSTDMMDAYFDAVGGRNDFDVFSGSLGTTLKCLDLGGKGGVVSAANYFPAECAEFLRLYHESDRETMLAYYNDLLALSKSTGGRGSVAGVKACMNLLGLRGGYPRVPVLPVSDTLNEEIREVLQKAGKL